MDLSGRWQAHPSEQGLLAAFVERDFDDGAWEPMPVPSHWRTTPAFADCDGPVLLRRRFPSPATDDSPEERWWLVVEGAFYSTDLWLDGTYLGDTEGYFFPHEFEVTDQLRTASEHVLAAEVTCAPQRDRTAKRNLTGVLQHWDCIDPDWNPGGLWRPVRLEPSGPIRIRHLRVLCTAADSQHATVFVRTVLDAVAPGPAQLVTRIGGAEHVESRSLAAGENRVEWTVSIPEPDLWWPRALTSQAPGAQPEAQALHDLEVTVHTTRPGKGGEADRGVASDRRVRRVGLRSLRMRNWILEVNGERLFVKGTNLAPTRAALGDATPEEVRADISLAADAGLDMVRVHAHVGRPELYDAADEAGLLVWQDFPMQWGYARSVRRQARRQARELVDQLGHHPCVALWCGHNEPLALDIEPGSLGDRRGRRRLAAKAAAGVLLPTWNKTVLDHSVRRVLARSDPSRPTLASSGLPPHPPTFEGGDSHLYLGWYAGDERRLPDLVRWWPKLARFVSEFGAQAVPASDDFMEPGRWPDLDWEHLGAHHALQLDRFQAHVRPDDHTTFEEWRTATQHYQAELIRHHVETLRRLKYRPTGGFLHFLWADAQPAVSWSVLDHRRVPKAGYRALVEACAPVIAVADRLPARVRPGERIALDVHVVSDLRAPIPEARVDATVHWPGGAHQHRWEGAVPADSCVRVGTVSVLVPEGTVSPAVPEGTVLPPVPEGTVSGAAVTVTLTYTDPDRHRTTSQRALLTEP